MKKRFSLGLFLTVMMLAMSSFTASAQTLYVDVNGDGDASIQDVTDLIDYLLGNFGTGTAVKTRDHISVSEFGAVGDGIADDTEALERVFEVAAEQGLSVYFPAGTYLIRRPLNIKSGMEIYGDGNNSIIRKIPAAWHKLTDAIETGVYNDDEDHTITVKVDGVEGYHVGDHCYISYSSNPFNPANAKARYCSYGEIAEINETPITEDGVVKYEVKFKSAFNSQKLGVVYRHPVGAVLSTSFPLLRSWAFKDECIDVYIHDLCLDGNRQTEGPTYNGVTYEPMEWANGCIHFDAYATTKTCGISYNNHSRNHIIERCLIINSSYDGISDQGEGGLYVKDCVIENCAMHGVHMGTIFSDAIITGNRMTGNGVRGAGVFFCQDVKNVVIDNNTISTFNHGCSDEEYASAGKFVLIRENTFNNITSYVFDFLAATSSKRGGGLQISNNTIGNLKNSMFAGDYIDNIIMTDNKISSIIGAPANLIKVTSATNVIITGNTIPSGVSVGTPVNATNVTNLIQATNSWD